MGECLSSNKNPQVANNDASPTTTKTTNEQLLNELKNSEMKDQQNIPLNKRRQTIDNMINMESDETEDDNVDEKYAESDDELDICESETIEECKHVENMIESIISFEKLLRKSKKNKTKTIKNKDLTNILRPIYNQQSDYNRVIKTDYQHILTNHSNEASFLYIYNQIRQHFKKQCNMSKCPIETWISNNTYIDDKYILLFSTFFIIHRYFIHSYDNGYKLDLNEENDENIKKFHIKIYKQIKKSMNIIIDSDTESEGEEMFKNIFIKQKIDENNDEIAENQCKDNPRKNRFLTSVCYEYDIKNENENENEDYYINIDENDNNFDENVYSIGIDWLYWDKYKDSKYYVKKKKKDFKLEMLHNGIYALQIEEFDLLMKYAKNNLYSKNGKSLKLNPNIDKEEYIIKQKNDEKKSKKGAPNKIKIEHLAAVELYCNHNKLHKELKKTFRKIKKNETLSEIKERHREFAILSRLLRECVELFGNTMRENINIKLYHCIECEDGLLVFPTNKIRFNGPTSLSNKLGIIINNVNENILNNNGMILQIGIYSMDITYFNCQWISNFGAESEYLIYGGGLPCFGSFLIRSVIIYKWKHDYRKYIKCINIILSLISNNYNPQYVLSNKLMKCIKMILKNNGNNKNNVPYYVFEMFENIRINYKDNIEIAIDRLNDENYYSEIKKIFISANDNSLIDFQMLTKTFVNSSKIIVHCDKNGENGIKLTNKTFKKIFALVNNNNDEDEICNINQIVLEGPDETKLTVDEVLEAWKDKFEEIGFGLVYREGVVNEDDNDDDKTSDALIAKLFIVKT